MSAKRKVKAVEVGPIKLDLGCGKNPREGFDGVDSRDFGQKYQVNLGNDRWPWKDGTVEECHTSHMIEHLNANQRIWFVNELYRVLKPGGKCTVITPHWGSCRAYGDLTHQWPPVSEFWFYYLSKDWRAVNAPHNDGYSCDFEAAWGYHSHPEVATRNPEYQQHAWKFWKEAIQDIQAVLTKK